MVTGFSAEGLGVVHVFQSGTPVADTMVPAFRTLATEGGASPFVSFYEMDADDSATEDLDALGIVSFPTFVVVAKPDDTRMASPGVGAVHILASFSASSLPRLTLRLQSLGILPE